MNKIALEVLSKLQEKGEAYIVGGCLRDIECDLIPNDIDIITSFSIEEVEKIFPYLNTTEKGKEFGVGRFTYKNILFEISSHPNENLKESIKERDYTINSLFHDGKELYDHYNAKDDIKNKIIRPLENPKVHFKKNPQAFIRGIRLSSYLNFDLSDELILFMHQNKNYFYDIDQNRLSQEGYKIISSDYPLRAISILQELKIISLEKEFDPNMKIKTFSDTLDTKFTFISSIIGLKPILEFIEIFKLSKRISEKVNYLVRFLDDSEFGKNPYIINEVLILKKYQYPNNPQKLRELILKFNENKKHL